MSIDWVYFRPFDKLKGLIWELIPNEYENFQFYYSDLISKIQTLNIICIRYKVEKNLFMQASQRENDLNEKENSLSEKEVFEEHIKNGKQLMKNFKLINLDVDSFFIFSRILLDRIPYLLRPLFKGIVTKQDVAIRDFKKFIDWFYNNPECILDPNFLDKMLFFRKWFYDELREPRNELIVHQEWDHIRQTITTEGIIMRLRYKLRADEDKQVWDIVKSTELTDLSILLEKIAEFLVFLNQYFYDKLIVRVPT